MLFFVVGVVRTCGSITDVKKAGTCTEIVCSLCHCQRCHNLRYGAYACFVQYRPRYHFNHYDYRNQQARNVIDKVWAKQYEAIAYINSVLVHLDQKSFAPQERKHMKGECLGLRAFLHFDVARLFCND